MTAWPKVGDTVRDGLNELANGLASRVLATRGLAAELSEGDRVALDRQWGQPGLADAVARVMTQTKRHPPDLDALVDQSIGASLSFGDEPTGEDAEQAAKVRLLAQASLAFQASTAHLDRFFLRFLDDRQSLRGGGIQNPLDLACGLALGPLQFSVSASLYRSTGE